MTKFNKSLQKRDASIVPFGPNLINRAGGAAYHDTPESALYKQIATSLWSGDGYYERQEEWFTRFQQNVAEAVRKDVAYPLQLAAYARDRKDGLALRSSPIALYAEAAMRPETKGSGLIRRYAPKILQRADEPAEVIAYLNRRWPHNGIPHGILRGIADVLPGFDEYQLAKYRKGAVSMRDVFRLARPKPQTKEQEELWDRVVSDRLETPYTWETELSQAATDEAKREKWNQLIGSGKLGLFALMRNIRNIVKYNADIEEALSQITKERVVGAGILPFQWYKAYKAVREHAGEAIAEPMQQAVEWSLEDLPLLPGTTLVACDNSGSMDAYVTRGLANKEIANLMGAMTVYFSQAGYAATFGSDFALADVNRERGIFGNKHQIDATGKTTGHDTLAWKIFQTLIRERIWVDRVIIFSDMQCYDLQYRHWMGGHSLSEELGAYLKMNPNVVVYSVNLQSQDNSTQFAPDQPVVELAGWSESIFRFMAAMEVGNSLIEHVKTDY